MKEVGTFRRRISWLVGLFLFGGSFLLEGWAHGSLMVGGLLIMTAAFIGSRPFIGS